MEQQASTPLFDPFAETEIVPEVASVSTLPSTVSQVNGNNNPKVAAGAIIVVVSIIAIILIAVLVYYFLSDPAEYPSDKNSTINKDFFKQQYSYHSWSPTFESPNVILHMYAPTGSVTHIPQTVGSFYKPVIDQAIAKEYAPLFRIQMANVGDLIGLSRLRKRGIMCSSYDVLHQWKTDKLFPPIEAIKCTERKISDQIMDEVIVNLHDLPWALFTFLQDSYRFAVLSKIIACETDAKNAIINFTILPFPEDESSIKFFQNLSNLESSPSDTYKSHHLECQLYNPQFSKEVFSHLSFTKALTWNNNT